MNSGPVFFLRLFGGPAIVGPDGAPLSGRVAQRHPLALLALLALAPDAGLTRDKIIGYLWPEGDEERARKRLSVTVYALRQALGDHALLSAGDELRLNRAVVRADAAEFTQALANGDDARAVELYKGPFLDGFYLNDAPEFERWVETERDRFGRADARALEALAEDAAARKDFVAAAEWWLARAAQDPYDTRVALRLVLALEASGNRAGALHQASLHQRLLEQDLGIEPPAELREAVEAIRSRRQEPPAASVVADVASAAPRHERDFEVATAAHDVPTQPSPADADPPGPPDVDTRTGSAHPRVRVLIAAVVGAVLVVGLAVALRPWLGDRAPTGPSQIDVARPGALATVEPATRNPPRRSLAVLPFTNLARDPDEEYFSDGLTEELISTLSQVRALRVVARTSAFAFRGENRDVREIGRALNVATVVEGSVRRDGERVRVTAQLIDAASGFHLWSESYERDVTDLFEIQRDVALRIARALAAELTPAEHERLDRKPMPDPEAYTLYLKGRHLFNQRTAGGLSRAIDYFEQAIAIDPHFAAAQAGIASVYAPQTMLGFAAPEQVRAKMRDAALTAVAADPSLSEAHTALGAYLHLFEWDFAASERAYLRAIELDPGYSTARIWYGFLLTSLTRFQEALEQKKLGIQLDPLSPLMNTSYASDLLFTGQPGLAADAYRVAFELDPQYWQAFEGVGRLHEQAGRWDEAIAAYESAAAFIGGGARARAHLARALALAGRTDEARRITNELRSEARRSGNYYPLVATALHALGETEQALDWLELAYRQRHPNITRLLADPGYSPMRADPRFLDLVRRVGLPH